MMARTAHVATVDLTHRFLLLPQLVALRDAGHDVTAIGASGPWVPEIEKEGIRYVPWTSVTRAWDPGADMRAFVELVAILTTRTVRRRPHAQPEARRDGARSRRARCGHRSS